MGHRVAPDALVDLFALEHGALGPGERLEQLELAAREAEAATGDEGLKLIRADLELAGGDGAAARRQAGRAGGGGSPPRPSR